MITYTQFIPGTGEIIGWVSAEDPIDRDDYILTYLDTPADPKLHYVDISSVPFKLEHYSLQELEDKAKVTGGWIWKMPERRVMDTRVTQEVRDQAWARIKAGRDIAEFAPFECEGRIYDADDAATRRISGATTGAMMAAMNGVPFSKDWTLADKTIVTLNGPQMMAVGAALISKVGSVFTTAQELWALTVNPSATIEELDAIVWPSNYLDSI